MKKSLRCFAVLCLTISMRLTAQTNVNTWYIIPPTSGCNGIWAVDALTYGPCSAGAQYTMNPMGCVQLGGPTVADTTYLTLCAFPCDLYLANTQSGQTCICSSGQIMNAEAYSSAEVITTYPNPGTTESGWNVLLHQPGENVTISIYNSLGQLVSSQTTENAEQVVHVDTSTLLPGHYTVSIAVNDLLPYNQQLFITR